jgi:hypothetical protein
MMSFDDSDIRMLSKKETEIYNYGVKMGRQTARTEQLNNKSYADGKLAGYKEAKEGYQFCKRCPGFKVMDDELKDLRQYKEKSKIAIRDKSVLIQRLEHLLLEAGEQ